MGALLGGCSERRAEPPPQVPAAQPAQADKPPPKPLRVGMDAAYPPFEFLGARGEIEGFDVELMQAIAARAGLSVSFVNTPWKVLFSALDDGTVDLVISAVAVTPERRQAMAFSDEYFRTWQLVVAAAHSKAKDLSGLAGRRWGVQHGTHGDDWVSAWGRGNGTTIQRFESVALALEALYAGAIDAVVADGGVVAHRLLSRPEPGLKLFSDPQMIPQSYAIALRTADVELRSRINAGLATVVADGTYLRIHRKYFGELLAQRGAAEKVAAPPPTGEPLPAAGGQASRPTRAATP